MTRSGRTRVIGLTGGIATGKSCTARCIRELGFPVIDADDLAREVVLPGSPALQRIMDAFGNEIILPEGTLDRKRLGAVVFADPGKRRQLEEIIHPEIRRLAWERVSDACQQGHPAVFYMAPLLIEAGATELVDEIWVVTVTPEIQLERLMVRDGMSREAAEQIIATQMPLEEKARHGKVVIDNSGTPAELHKRVAEACQKEIGC